VVVIGTGAGKSMLFILLASCLTGVMIIVVLLVLLQGNLKDCCKQVGIKCVK
jgi:superfamily II DNA helicase RecQ